MGNNNSSDYNVTLMNITHAYIMGLLSLKEIPLISNVKTYEEMLAYINNVNAEKIGLNIVTVSLCHNYTSFQSNDTRAYQTIYTYEGKKYAAQNPKKILGYTILYNYFGKFESNTLETSMKVLLPNLDQNHNKRHLKCNAVDNEILLLESPTIAEMTNIRNTIKRVVDDISVKINDKIKWISEQDLNTINKKILDLETHLIILKKSEQQLREEQKNFSNLSKEEYDSVIDDIKLNKTKQMKTQKKITNNEEIISAIGYSDTYCKIAKLQQTILQHFLFVTNWCELV